MALYIGLMSGTSMDGVDAALVDISADTTTLHAFISVPYPAELKQTLDAAVTSYPATPLETSLILNAKIGVFFAAVTKQLLAQTQRDAAEITAIGSHGQTVVHKPNDDPAYTLQIGDPSIIAHETGITTVADFRSGDVAAGGQGAPLVPAFHAAAFRSTAVDRFVVNIGGIANVTVLPADLGQPIIAFDTGPGNCLMDEWIREQRDLAYDEDGQWARQGTPSEAVLRTLLEDPYFKQPAPKSTGRDYFNLAWLREHLPQTEGPMAAADLQATLVALTATTVYEAISPYFFGPGEIYLCGGGAFNSALQHALREQADPVPVATTSALGIAPESVEATAFAMLAHHRMNEVRLPNVTGANAPVIAGGVWLP